MRMISKKLTALLLCLALTVGCFTFLGSVGFAADDVDGTVIPTIYVPGKNSAPLAIKNEDGTSTKVFPITIPEDFIEKAVEENIDVFAKAFFTQEWAEFGDVLADVLGELYGVIKLDEHGNSQNNVYLDWTWSKSSLNGNKVNGKYPTERYTFKYDWRLDPCENADILKQYIEDVREVTGADKVALVGRCLGASVAMAYMEKYDAEYISDFVLYSSALDGATQCSKAFAGELYLDPDGIERFVYDFEIFDDESINELLQAFITVFNATYGLDITCWAINNVVTKKYLDLLPKALMNTFASFPGYWAMVSDCDYIKAKETVFYGKDKEQYADLIAKLDNFHYNVQVKSNELLKEYSERGIEISNITKYGSQTVPMTREADIVSDTRCSVYDSSKGATTARLLEGFDDEYIENAKLNGTEKYISPDRLIDASTCLFPETTWYVKELDHRDFPFIMNTLIDVIINNDGVTVDSDENYPRYMIYSKADNTLLPLTADNMNTEVKYETSFFDSLKKLFEFIVNYIKQLISGSAEKNAA